MVIDGLERNVVVAHAGLVEFAFLGPAGGDDRELGIAVFGIELLHHSDGVQHRAVGRRQMGQQFGVVDFDETDDGRTRLGNDRGGIVFLDVLQIALDGQFGTETDIEKSAHSDRLEPAIELEILMGEIGGHARRHNGHQAIAAPGGLHEGVEVINSIARIVGTGREAPPATNAKILVDLHIVPASIVAEFDRTNGNARMTIYTTISIHFNDFGQRHGISLG